LIGDSNFLAAKVRVWTCKTASPGNETVWRLKL